MARVTNLAEAGFLTDELVGLGIDARIYQLEEFSAVSDHWASLYLIRVPAEVAQEAAGQIRQYLEDDLRDRQNEPETFQFSIENQSADPQFWRPVAIVVLAGVASFVLGQRLSEQNPGRRPPQNSLPSAIDEIGRPLTTEPAPDKPRYRLSFDRRHEAWTLDTDRDNDGRFESSEHFHASGAAW